METRINRNSEINSYHSGVVSIYLCMMFAIMITIICVMIEGARSSAMALSIECATDMGTDSLLAEYHKELLDRYGLLFIDTSYSGDRGSLSNVSDHLKDYMEYNLSPDKGLKLTGKTRDYYGLSVDSVDILNVSRATDDDGSVFRHMALSYMLDTYGLSIIDNAKDLIATSDSYHLDEGDIFEDNREYQSQIDAIDYPDMEGVDWDEVDTSNPSANARYASKSGILALVCPGSLSGKAYNLDTVASNRDLVSGVGLIDNWPDYDGPLYDILFSEYILKKLGNYTDIKDDSAMNYQIEYVLFGKSSDKANLTKTAERLAMIRGASNMIYYLSDSGLQAEVSAVALGLAVITFMPWLYTLYKLALAAALVLAESLYDVNVLLKGGKVPLIKGKGDWTFSIEGAIEKLAGTFTDSSEKNDKGQDYKDYLRILLYLTGNNKKLSRTMDIVEMDIRNITGKNNFRLDDCIAGGQAQIILSSTYGYSFFMKRYFSYQ